MKPSHRSPLHTRISSSFRGWPPVDGKSIDPAAADGTSLLGTRDGVIGGSGR